MIMSPDHPLSQKKNFIPKGQVVLRKSQYHHYRIPRIMLVSTPPPPHSSILQRMVANQTCNCANPQPYGTFRRYFQVWICMARCQWLTIIIRSSRPHETGRSVDPLVFRKTKRQDVCYPVCRKYTMHGWKAVRFLWNFDLVRQRRDVGVT